MSAHAKYTVVENEEIKTVFMQCTHSFSLASCSMVAQLESTTVNTIFTRMQNKVFSLNLELKYLRSS
jgi:hypothetical protein